MNMIKKLKSKKESGLKTFEVKWTVECRKQGHTIVKARDTGEAKKKFWANDCKDDIVDDEEFIDCWIDEVEEVD